MYDSKGHPDAEGIGMNDIRMAQSLVFRLSMAASFVPLGIPVFIQPDIWGAWKYSNTITGKGFPWSYGFGFNVMY